MAKKRGGKKRNPPARRASSKRTAPKGPAHAAPGPKITWSGLKDPDNESVDECGRRYYKLETFANAVEKRAQEKDRLLNPAIRALSGDQAASLRFVFKAENVSTLRFDATFVSKDGKRVSAVLAAAKNAQEHSSTLKRGFRALEHAAELAPKLTSKPVSSGHVFLPDRHRRKEYGREIFCCIYTHPPGFVPLAAGPDGRLGLLKTGFKKFSEKEDRQARLRLVRLVAQTYAPAAQTGIQLPDLAEEQILARRDPKHGVRVLLAFPEGLRRRLSVPKLLHELLTWEAAGPAGPVRLRPSQTADFIEALTAGVGRETAEQWLLRYRRAVEQGRFPPIPPLRPEELAEAGVGS